MKYLSYVCGLLIVSMVLSGCGAGSPSGPVQIPTTVEFMGEGGGDIVAVQTEGAATFVVKNASGEQIDPGTVTAIVTAPDGTPATDDNYGTASISSDGQYIQYDAPSDFPNLESRAGIKFESNVSGSISSAKVLAGDALGSFDLGISVNPLQIESGAYSFSDQAIGHGRGARISAAPSGELFVLYEADVPGSAHQSKELRLTKYNDVDQTFSAPFTQDGGGDGTGAPYSIVVQEPENNDFTGFDVAPYYAYDTATKQYVYDSVAVYYTLNDNVSPHQAAYVMFREGDSWATVLVGDSNGSNEDMAFDANGILHLIYPVNIDGDYMINYVACTSGGCGTAIRLNENGALVGSEYRLKLAIDQAEADLEKIYAVWLDATDTIVPPFVTRTVLSELSYVPSSGAAAFVRNTRVQGSSGYDYDLPWHQTVTVDRNHMPVVTWSQFFATTAQYEEQHVASGGVYTAMYDPVALAFNGNTTVKYEADIDFNVVTNTWPISPFMSIDYSNYGHLVWYEEPVTGDDDLPTKMKYTIGVFEGTGVDKTFRSIPELTVKEIAIWTAVGGYDVDTDKAGRSYLTWLDTNTLDADGFDINITIGSIRL